MDNNKQINELHSVAHIVELFFMAIFTLFLLLLNRILHWEVWVIPPFLLTTVICWALHVSNRVPQRTQVWICSIFLMVEVFYYTARINTIYDSTAVIILLLLLLAFTGERTLTMIGVITGIFGMIFHEINHTHWGNMTGFSAIRTIWHFILVIAASVLVFKIIDIWERIEIGYRQQINEVSTENERVNNFLANVSHEIRTPINAVMGLSAVLETEPLTESEKSNVAAISRAGHRVAEQIGDILDFTEIDMGKLSVNNESYLTGSLINDLLTQLRFTEAYDLDLVIDLEADVPTQILGDGSKIRKILWHLIMNSLKFTANGGVYVHIYSIPRDYGINLVLEIADTGIGMTDEEIEHIYDKYYQADSGRTRMAGGLGLGLSIVNGFTSAMGGMLAIESAPAQGTMVRVSLPQTVEDETPCLSVSDHESCVAAGFLGFMTTGHPGIREYYLQMITHLSQGLKINFHRVQSREELEQLIAQVQVTHLFVGTGEYLTNREYIESLTGRMNVALVADRGFNEPTIPEITLLPKPFYGLQVANFLNHSLTDEDKNEGERMMCPNLRALVVDDEPMNLLVARGIFESYGMIVTTANSGEESIDLCSEQDFDIVFMDHMMPGMDGVEAMKRLRAQAGKKGQEIAIVALTANAISSAKEMFLSEGFDGFVPKPIELMDLERVLKHVLPKSAIVYEAVQKKRTLLPAKIRAPASEFEALAALGVDIKKGLEYCQNDKDFFKELLMEFASEKEDKLEKLAEAYRNKDWKFYEIKVHAVKSSAKMLGAMLLSDTAKALEEAAGKGDETFLAGTHGEFMERYKAFMLAADAVKATQEDSDPEDEIFEFLPEGGAD